MIRTIIRGFIPVIVTEDIIFSCKDTKNLDLNRKNYNTVSCIELNKSQKRLNKYYIIGSNASFLKK